MKSYIGDAVMAAPLIPHLERAFPEMDILASGAVDQVLWTPTRDRKFLKLPRVRNPISVIRQGMLLRKRGYSCVVLVNHSFRSAMTVRLAGIPKRIGHDKEHRGRFLTDIVPYDESRFEAFCILDLARPLGIEPPEELPELPVAPAEIEKGRQIVRNAVVGFQPGARWPKKQVPLEVMAEVARHLLKAGYIPVLLGGREEAPFAESFRTSLKGEVVDLVGSTGIRDTLGVLKNLRLLVGSDTGLMHLGASVGCPTVTAFGPTVAAKWGHDYPPHRVLRAPGRDIRNVRSEAVIECALEVLGAS